MLAIDSWMVCAEHQNSAWTGWGLPITSIYVAYSCTQSPNEQSNDISCCSSLLEIQGRNVREPRGNDTGRQTTAITLDHHWACKGKHAPSSEADCTVYLAVRLVLHRCVRLSCIASRLDWNACILFVTSNPLHWILGLQLTSVCWLIILQQLARWQGYTRLSDVQI